MTWKIEFYSEEVEASIKEWPDGMIAKFLWVSNVIEKFGPNKIGMPHIFIKKTEKTPSSELELARKRMKEVKAHE